MRMRTLAIELVTISFLFAAGAAIEPALAANAPAASVPCSGVWELSEQLTRRARSAYGPTLQFFEPWGKNGLMRMNNGDPTAQFGEWHFELLNNQPYQVFGADPSLERARRISDRIYMITRVRAGQDADPSLWIFSKDCKFLTNFGPEGVDRHGPPGQNQYINDTRVYQRIDPPSGGAVAPVAPGIFGGWELNRSASKLTLSKEAETVVIVPWGASGWVWYQLSGGSYQPENLHKAVKRVECGAASGPTAVPCQGPKTDMLLYWATWDSKSYPSLVPHHVQVQLKRVNAQNFEVTYFKAPQTAAQGDKATVAFSPDGKHLTVTTKSGAPGGPNHFEDDVRVYDLIDPENWPTVAP
jgi:hypothetical protein